MLIKNLNLDDIFKLFHPTLKHTYSFQGHTYILFTTIDYDTETYCKFQNIQVYFSIYTYSN